MVIAFLQTGDSISPLTFLLTFGLYILSMITLSVFISKKQHSGADFLLGGRSVPILLMLGTTIATLVGTGSSMGAVGKGYSTGWIGAFYGIGGALGMMLLAVLFSKARKLRFMTMSEEISYYFGANKAIKNLVGILTYIASIGWLGAHIMGGAKYLSWISDIDLLYCKIIITIAFSIYVIVGGYLAVVWTDTIQAIILFLGFILMGIYSMDNVGGGQALIAMGKQRAEIFFDEPVLPAISLAFAIAVAVLATPSYRQRIYSADSVNNVKKSFLYTGIIYLFFSFFPAIIGMTAYQLNPGLTDPDTAFIYLASDVLPLAMGILVIIAGLSATMSSASSDAIAGVSILLRDVYGQVFGKLPDKRNAILFSRIGIGITTGIALVFTLFSETIIGYINGMIGIILSGLFASTVLGKFWKRATWQGGISAILSGSVTAIIINLYSPWQNFWGNGVIPAVAMALLCGILVSLMTPPRATTHGQALAILEEERKQIE
ncbi:sodium:solute symporter family protein [Fulvivirgaceae bacterium BMA10]|uniref:Sodium:solute symporter family protein n=1 Tax=Splendidivirga corallicola TaxID=3051826 RepID=A0ABT8KP82_9BACT|nr:sodium:solute symporter family protein [Fulvivirgaceae bacterium BMA10]